MNQAWKVKRKAVVSTVVMVLKGKRISNGKHRSSYHPNPLGFSNVSSIYLNRKDLKVFSSVVKREVPGIDTDPEGRKVRTSKKTAGIRTSPKPEQILNGEDKVRPSSRRISDLFFLGDMTKHSGNRFSWSNLVSDGSNFSSL